MTCIYCGLTDCDCKARMACNEVGKPGHTMCGRKPCGCPKFIPCSHEGNKFDRGMGLSMPDSVLASLITRGRTQ